MKKNSPSASTPTRRMTASLVASAIAGAFFAVLCVGNVLNAGKLPLLSPDFIQYFHPLYYAIAWVVLTAVLLLYGTVSRRFVYIFTYIASLAYALATALIAENRLLMFAMCGLCALMTVLCGQALAHAPSEKKRRECTISPLACKITLGAVAVVVGGTVLFLAVSSYLSYTTSGVVSNSTYIQMMHSLRESFSFDTTVEFGEAVSHMAAHYSPIFLLYLPFYAILPSPLTLLVLQVVSVFSAVIPLWLIARRRGVSAGMSALLCGLLCTFPAVWCATSYSLHEYALLLPLLLWLIFAWESKRYWLLWSMALLVLCVRETAAIHLFTLGLYWLITHRRETEVNGESKRAERIRALILMGVSAVYLAVALILLSTLGRGILITRYDNVTGVYGSFFDSFLRELFTNPALTLYELFSVEKFFYVLTLLLPLGLLPLLSRRRTGLVFLFPLLLLNLLADYPYHYDTDFPYGFGVTAFGFYLAVLALEEWRLREGSHHRIKQILAIALGCTLIISACRLSDVTLYTEYALHERAEIAAMDELLDMLDPNASVSASGRLRPNLAARDELYRLEQKVMTDYVVLDLREDWMLPAEEAYDPAYYTDLGYHVIAEVEGVGVILGK